MVKKIATKQIGNVQYDLVLFEGDHVYVIYKWDYEALRDGSTQLIPEVGRFSLEEEARKEFEALDQE